MNLSYFKADEFKCQHCGADGIDYDFARTIDKLRHECQFPFLISSGYRCCDHPIEIRKEKPGAHTTGQAVDIAVTGEQAITVLREALNMGFSRIGVQQKGTGRFIHLDMAEGFPAPAIWSY